MEVPAYNWCITKFCLKLNLWVGRCLNPGSASSAILPMLKYVPSFCTKWPFSRTWAPPETESASPWHTTHFVYGHSWVRTILPYIMWSIFLTRWFSNLTVRENCFSSIRSQLGWSVDQHRNLCFKEFSKWLWWWNFLINITLKLPPRVLFWPLRVV